MEENDSITETVNETASEFIEFFTKIELKLVNEYQNNKSVELETGKQKTHPEFACE